MLFLAPRHSPQFPRVGLQLSWPHLASTCSTAQRPQPREAKQREPGTHLPGWAPSGSSHPGETETCCSSACRETKSHVWEVEEPALLCLVTWPCRPRECQDRDSFTSDTLHAPIRSISGSEESSETSGDSPVPRSGPDRERTLSLASIGAREATAKAPNPDQSRLQEHRCHGNTFDFRDYPLSPAFRRDGTPAASLWPHARRDQVFPGSPCPLQCLRAGPSLQLLGLTSQDRQPLGKRQRILQFISSFSSRALRAETRSSTSQLPTRLLQSSGSCMINGKVGAH